MDRVRELTAGGRTAHDVGPGAERPGQPHVPEKLTFQRGGVQRGRSRDSDRDQIDGRGATTVFEP